MSGRAPGRRLAGDTVEETLTALEDALERTSGAGVRLIRAPAPVGAPESLLGGATDADRVALFWTTPGGPIQAGLGAAAVLRGEGPDRLGSVREQAEALWQRIESVDLTGDRAPAPRVYGGVSFVSGPTTDEWRPFGDATFVLPRLLYARTGDRATLTLALGGEGPDARMAATGDVLDQARALLQRVCGSAPGEPARPRGNGARPGGSDPDPDARTRWEAAVRSIQARIRTEAAEKIVAARSRAVPVPDPDVSRILRRLARESSTAARFAFRFGGSVFLGATPERLVSRCGRAVRTEALAGSVPAGDPAREARLVESLKDGVEHGYVVQAIVDALEPLCRRLERPAEPRVQRLRHVLHLQTPFDGTLREDVHILELVERLHPTPAVGGLPTAEALDWIRREETGSRGWYAGPVGWFDAEGDGEFGVALRSGLLADGRAHLYAGAGIVRDSDPRAEFEETEVKLRTMLDALGALE